MISRRDPQSAMPPPPPPLSDDNYADPSSSEDSDTPEGREASKQLLELGEAIKRKSARSRSPPPDRACLRLRPQVQRRSQEICRKRARTQTATEMGFHREWLNWTRPRPQQVSIRRNLDTGDGTSMDLKELIPKKRSQLPSRELLTTAGRKCLALEIEFSCPDSVLDCSDSASESAECEMVEVEPKKKKAAPKRSRMETRYLRRIRRAKLQLGRRVGRLLMLAEQGVELDKDYSLWSSNELQRFFPEPEFPEVQELNAPESDTVSLWSGSMISDEDFTEEEGVCTCNSDSDCEPEPPEEPRERCAETKWFEEELVLPIKNDTVEAMPTFGPDFGLDGGYSPTIEATYHVPTKWDIKIAEEVVQIIQLELNQFSSCHDLLLGPSYADNAIL